MNIYITDIDRPTAANRNPSGLYPFARDVPVNQDMEVRVPVLLEFKNSDVLRSNGVLTPQINPQFGENGIQITNGTARNLRRIEG